MVAEACVRQRRDDPGSFGGNGDGVLITGFFKLRAGIQQFFPGFGGTQAEGRKRVLVVEERNAALVKRKRLHHRAAGVVLGLGQNDVVIHVADKAVLIRMLHIQNRGHIHQIALVQRCCRTADNVAKEVGMDDIRRIAAVLAGEDRLHLGSVRVVVCDHVDGDRGFRVQLHVLLCQLLFASGVVAVDDSDNDLVILAGVPCCIGCSCGCFICRCVVAFSGRIGCRFLRSRSLGGRVGGLAAAGEHGDHHDQCEQQCE